MNFSYVCTYSRSVVSDSCVNSISSNSLASLPISSPRGNHQSDLFHRIRSASLQLCVTGFVQHERALLPGFFHSTFCVWESSTLCAAVACSCLNAVSPCLVLKMPLQAFVTTVLFSFIHLKSPESGPRTDSSTFISVPLTKCSPYKDHLKDRGSVNSWNI